MSKDRFKFRFWNKLRNNYENTYDLKSFEVLDYVIAEQCTGLKDKNGNLIYEGDIIEDDNTKSDTGVVVWSRAGFKVKMYRYNQIVNIKKNIRVIGNIHEEQTDVAED